MQRIPEHKDLMDDIEQARAYAEADFSEPHETFVQHFATRFPDFSTGEVLDLGCGTADVIIRFARAFPKAHITGIDGAQAMLDIAVCDVRQKGFQSRICLKHCNLPDSGILKKKFDAVISNSLLHHLEDPLTLWHTIRQCASPGAPVFIMDLLRPDNVESAKGLSDKYAADASAILRKDFFNSLLAAYSMEEIRSQLDESHFDSLSVEKISDRHVLIWGVSE